jgi:hypothetical protein
MYSAPRKNTANIPATVRGLDQVRAGDVARAEDAQWDQAVARRGLACDKAYEQGQRGGAKPQRAARAPSRSRPRA